MGICPLLLYGEQGGVSIKKGIVNERKPCYNDRKIGKGDEEMADFSPLQAYMEHLHRDMGVPGCYVAVYRHGEPVYRYHSGYADREHTRPVSEDDLYYLYSCTKPITVTAAMQLVEQGKMGLEDPVCRYLPEYADAYYRKDGQPVPVGDTMTLRHLFTMSAGLTYDRDTEAIAAVKRQYGEAATTRQLVAAFAKQPLVFAPGERFQYSLCHDVLAAVVEVVSGQRFGEYLQAHIFRPLGMTDTGFVLSPDQYARMADQYVIDGEKQVVPVEKRNAGFQLSEQYESGGAGLFSSAADYGRFAAAMACGGVAADGTRILRAETVDMMRTQQMGGYVMNNNFSCSAGQGYGYGLGVRTLVDRSAGQRSSLGEFGWDGAAGSYILMDPAPQVAIVYTQHVLNWPARFGSIHAPLRDLTYEALNL